MYSKILAATALALSVSVAPAMASSDGPLPYDKWNNSIRSMFFDEDRSIRADEEITAGWKELSPKQQASIKADCDSAFPPAGSSDLTSQQSETTDNPVPGAAQQLQACDLVRSM